MGRISSMHEKNDKFIQNFIRKILREEIAIKVGVLTS
jgi:hypothetical protein